MKPAITGPTVAPDALQFDPISAAAAFPRVARLARGREARVAEGPFGTLLRRVELPGSYVARMKNVRLVALVFRADVRLRIPSAFGRHHRLGE